MGSERDAKREIDLARRAAELARRRGASFAEVRTAAGCSVGLSVQDGRAERMGASSVRGGCVRVIVGERWGFASTDGLDWRRLSAAVEAAVGLARAGRALGRPAAVARSPRAGAEPTLAGDFAAGTGEVGGRELAGWARTLLAFERAARAHAAGRAVNTMASFSRNAGRSALANSQGLAAARASQRETAALMVVVAEPGRGIQRWTERAGRTGDGSLLAELAPGEFPEQAAARALAVLRARPCPGGPFPVILDPATAGVLVHECLGHNAEADLVLSGQSLLDGKLGRPVASPHVTVVDDPTIPRAFGSYEFDSEGTPAGRTEIISRGVLKTYLHSLETAARCRARPTGHGRADGYGAPPLVRMSNTFFAPGKRKLAEMIREVPRGLLLEHGASGQVLSERGHYTVGAGCGRLIENGRLAELVRDVTISGLVLESLRDIDAVSDDFRLESPGYCGKDGQEVPVDNGGAYVRLRKAVVGGRGRWPGRRQLSG
jgi:TldD protein